MHEKLALVAIEDYGKDLSTVHSLQRKHDVFERELEALGTKVQETVRTADRLEVMYVLGLVALRCDQVEFPDNMEDILMKREEVAATWELLQEQSEASFKTVFRSTRLTCPTGSQTTLGRLKRFARVHEQRETYP